VAGSPKSSRGGVRDSGDGFGGLNLRSQSSANKENQRKNPRSGFSFSGVKSSGICGEQKMDPELRGRLGVLKARIQ